MLAFLLQSSILFFFFYAIYWLLLRHETHHQLNRGILLFIMLIVLTLPFIPFPEQATEIREVLIPERATFFIDNEAPLPILNNEAIVLETPDDTTPINWLQLIFYIYLLIVIATALRFIAQLSGLLLLLSRSKISTLDNVYLAESDIVFQPFSFFNIIFIGANTDSQEMQDQILQHEMIHAQQWHSVDIILAELFAILFWFHPFTRSLKKNIRLNLEYIVDAEMLETGTNRKAYQYSLLKVSTGNRKWNLSNNFNHSFIKKRIIMMNHKKSSNTTKLKYLLFIPIFIFSYILINSATAQNNIEKAERALKLAEKKREKAEKAFEKALRAYEEAHEREVEEAHDHLSEEELREIAWQERETEKEALRRELERLQEEDHDKIFEELERAVEAENELAEEKKRIAIEALRSLDKEKAVRSLEAEIARLQRQLEEAEVDQQIEEERREMEEREMQLTEEELDHDNIYVVIRSTFERDQLRQLQRDIEVYGISLEFPELEYNAEGKITKIKMVYNTAEGKTGYAYSYNNGGPIDIPIVFYRLAGDPHEYGIDAGITDRIEKSLRESMKRLNGYFFGNFH